MIVIICAKYKKNPSRAVDANSVDANLDDFERKIKYVGICLEFG